MSGFSFFESVEKFLSEKKDDFVLFVAFKDLSFFLEKAMKLYPFASYVAQIEGLAIKKRDEVVEKVKRAQEELTDTQKRLLKFYEKSIFSMPQDWLSFELFKVFFTKKSLQRFRPIFNLTAPRGRKTNMLRRFKRGELVQLHEFLSLSEFTYFKFLEEVFYQVNYYLIKFKENSWEVINRSPLFLVYPLIFPKPYVSVVVERNKVLKSLEAFCKERPSLAGTFEEFRSFLKTAEEKSLILNQFVNEVREKREEIERGMLAGMTIREFAEKINKKRRRGYEDEKN